MAYFQAHYPQRTQERGSQIRPTPPPAVALARPINHGVCTAGIAMRHVIKLLFPGEPERLRRFKCRFTSPVLPGTKLRTQVWKISDTEARFRVVDADAFDAAVAAGERTPKPFLNSCLVEWE